MASHKVTVDGNTRPIKESLKKLGFKWAPLNLCWTCTLSDVHAEQIKDGSTRDATLRAFGWRLKGVRITVDGVIVFQSATYSTAPVAPLNVPVDEYDMDAAGNVCRGARIPGSLDHI
jgi:hypothetical protein